MRWLMHGNLASAVGEALRRHGHEVRPWADCGLNADAPKAEVVRWAQKEQLDLITDDAACAGVPFEDRIVFGRCIVYLRVPQVEVEQDDAVDRFFRRYPRPSPGRLYTVTGSRVKVRQLPGQRSP